MAIPDPPEELEQADRRIADAEARVTRQPEIIAQLTTDGHHTADAKQLLGTMEDILAPMQKHRELILREARGQL
jgi:hypothetical protein